jgi:hypothetical protein
MSVTRSGSEGAARPHTTEPYEWQKSAVAGFPGSAATSRSSRSAPAAACCPVTASTPSPEGLV